MDILTSIETAFAIRSYLLTLKDYFSPVVRKTRKRLKGEFFEYDMAVDGDLLFWRDALKKEFFNPLSKKIEESSKFLRVGDVVELDNSNVSRWIPIFPGKKCSTEGKEIMEKHIELFPENHDFGLEEELVMRNDANVLSGSANGKFLPFHHEYLLCASGLWCVFGIPILMTEKIYDEKVVDLISKDGGLNAKIVGTLSELPGDWKDRVDQKGLKVPYSEIYGLPRIVLKVEEIKKIGTPSRIIAEAWTQFVNAEYKQAAMMCSIFSPLNPDDIEKAVTMIANYKKFLESGLIGGKWKIDIEFDETRNWFKSGKYRKFKISGEDLFGVYYANPWGRVLKKQE